MALSVTRSFLASAIWNSQGALPDRHRIGGVLHLLALKGVPYLAVSSVLGGLLYSKPSERRLPVRAALFGANIIIAWLVAASIALAILG